MMREINVKKIMEEIQKEMLDENMNDDVLDFDEFCDNNLLELEKSDMENLHQDLNYLKNYKEVQTWHSYMATSFLGKIKVIYKKIVRKCVGFYVQPMILDQNQVNNKMYEVVEQLYFMQQMNVQHIDRLQKKIKELENGRTRN